MRDLSKRPFKLLFLRNFWSYLGRNDLSGVLGSVLSCLRPHQVSLSNTETHRGEPVCRRVVPHPGDHKHGTAEHHQKDSRVSEL